MQFRNVSLLGCLGLILSLCAPTAKAEAILASVKSTGMAATAIAYPLDAACIAYNPAGIMLVGDRLDIGAVWLHNTGSSRVSNNLSPTVNGSFEGMSRKNIYAGDIGITKQFSCECFNWALGFAAYDRNFQKTRFKKVQPLFGTTKPGLEYVHVTLAPTIAIELWECHSLGVSVDWQIERLKVNGLQNFDNPLFTLHPGDVTNRGYDYSHGVTATIGWRSQIFDWLAFGATYQPKTTMSKMKKYKGFLVKGRLDVPEKVGAGIALYPIECCAIAFDVEWIRWSQVHSLSNKLLHDNVLMLLGTENGPGFGFRNQWYYRVGVDYQLDDYWTIRAGFRYAPTPVRSTQTAVNALTLDLVQNFLTVGATFRYDCNNEFSAFFAWGFRHQLKGDNVIPLIPFGGGNVSLKEQKYAAGLSWGWLY